MTTRPFMTGRSQAIRLPKEFRLPDEEIFVNRVGDTIVLTPVSKMQSTFREALANFTPDFMAEGRPPQTIAGEEAL